jgi:periplasmic protein TonB
MAFRGTGEWDRAASAVTVAAIHALLAYGLLQGLQGEQPLSSARPLPPPLALLHVDLPAATPAKSATARPEGAAAPPNREAIPTPVTAPRRALETPLPTAPVADEGDAPAVGAAPLPGPGTGSGGIGDGPGSGSLGSGRGGAGGLSRKPELVSGRIQNTDYPRAAAQARAGGDVTVRLDLSETGRVTACTLLRSSGHAALDETTCRLIRERFRYRPALDREGSPVSASVGWRQSWWLERSD